MNHEALLAQTLGDDEQEKLAAHFDSYTADELAELLQRPDMTGMEKLVAYTEETNRRVRGEKTAGIKKESSLMPMGQAPASKAYVQREQSKGGRFLNRASDLLSAPKMASVQVVDGWARELAHEDIEKVSTGMPSMGGLTAGLSVKPPKPAGLGAMTMKPGSVGGIPKVGAARLRAEMDKMAFWGSGAIASGINKAAPYLSRGVRSLVAAGPGKSALIGAGVGAAGGAARHALSGRDPQTGQKRTTLMGSMLGGAALGGAAGAGLSAGAKRFQGSPLHARMTGGNFQFAGPAPQQASLPGMQGPSGPDTVPMNRPAPAPAPAPAQQSWWSRLTGRGG